MSKGTKLIIAGILFLLYGAFAIYSGILPGSARHNQAKLQAAVDQQVSKTSLQGVKVEMDGQLARLSGVLPSEEARKNAIKTVLSSEWQGGVFAGGVTVVRADELSVKDSTPAAPFVWTAELNGGSVILSGLVPDEISRSNILAHTREKFSRALRNEDIKVIDRMSVAAGAPAGNWLGAAKASVDSLAMLKSGKATGDGLAFNVTGRADSDRKKTSAENRVAALPEGYSATTNIVAYAAPSPYLWNAVLADNQTPITLTGFVPDEATRALIVGRAKERSPQGVIDNLQIAAGVPDGDWAGNILTSIDALAMLESGSISGRDKLIELRGVAGSLDIANNIGNFETSMTASGYQGVVNVTIPDAPKIEDADQCQDLFNDAMSKTSIRFGNASAEILPESEPILNKLALAARQCDAFKITIAGHTDSVGGAALNQKLSEARAQSVAKWLTDKGARAGQLTARGFGETEPIADNSTPGGRARNRRIDFSIQQ